MVHSDLKPSNIMLEVRSCSMVLVDFGLSKHVDAKQTLTIDHSSLLCTLPYLAAEALDEHNRL